MSNIEPANLLVENQFFAPNCQTAPDTIYVFYISNPYSYDNKLNETWPSFFRFHFSDFTVGDTDNCYVPINGTACTVSLLDTYYKSGSTSWYQDLNSVVPTAANSNSYCKLSANDRHSLFGYYMMLIHAQEGTCFDGYYTCERYNFTIYSKFGCIGNYTIINMEQPRNIASPLLGNVHVEYKIFTDATMVYAWIQYTPLSALVPHFHITFDYIGAAMYSSAILLALYCPIKSIYTFKANKKLLNHLILVYQLCFLAWSILSLIFWATIFPSEESMSIFAEIRTLFFNFGTLLSTIVSSFLYNLVLFGKTRQFTIYYFQVGVVFIHILLNGGSYYDYLLNGGSDNLIAKLSPGLQNFLITWNTYSFFWILFMYLWDCLPPILLSLLLLGDKPLFEKFKDLIRADPYLPHVVVCQIVSIGGYVTVGYIKRHTSLLGSDLAYQDATGFSVFSLMLHLSLTTRISDTMKIVSRKTSSHSAKRSDNRQPLLV